MINFRKNTLLLLIISLTAFHNSHGISNNWEMAELATALARAPMVMIAQQYEDEDSKKALTLTLLQDAVRMTNELLSIYNAQNTARNAYKVVWGAYDAAHFAKTLFKLFTPQAQQNQELYDTQTDITVQKLTEHLHNYILPFCEGAAATCIAWNNKTPQHQQYLARIEALGSLARVLSDALVSKKETLEGNLTLAALVISIVVTLYEFRDIIAPTKQPNIPAPVVPTPKSLTPSAPTPGPSAPTILETPTSLPTIPAPTSLPLPIELPVPAHDEIPASPTSTSLPTIPAPTSLPLPIELPAPAHDEIPTRVIIAPTIVPAPICAPRIGHHRRNTMEMLIDENAAKGIKITTHRTRNQK